MERTRVSDNWRGTYKRNKGLGEVVDKAEIPSRKRLKLKA